jgi:hypothetical protein
MSADDWQTRLAARWERRLATSSLVDPPGRVIPVDTLQWRLWGYMFMLVLVVAVGVFGGLRAAVAFGAAFASIEVLARWLRRRQASRMGPAALLLIGMERSARWAKAGLTWEYGRENGRTENPSWWLALRGPHSSAVLTVWASGDASVDPGDQRQPTRHYSVSSAEDVNACVDVLEATVRGDS